MPDDGDKHTAFDSSAAENRLKLKFGELRVCISLPSRDSLFSLLVSADTLEILHFLQFFGLDLTFFVALRRFVVPSISHWSFDNGRGLGGWSLDRGIHPTSRILGVAVLVALIGAISFQRLPSRLLRYTPTMPLLSTAPTFI